MSRGGGRGTSARIESVYLFMDDHSACAAAEKLLALVTYVTRGGDQTTGQHAVCRDTIDESLI